MTYSKERSLCQPRANHPWPLLNEEGESRRFHGCWVPQAAGATALDFLPLGMEARVRIEPLRIH